MNESNTQITQNFTNSSLIKEVINELNGDDIYSIVLFGSYARGQVSEFSDLDITCFSKTDRPSRPMRQTLLRNNRLVVVDCVTPAQAAMRLQVPELIVVYLYGISNGVILVDKENYFQRIQQIANSFQWNDVIQERANLWANAQLMFLVEYVYKALSALNSSEDYSKLFFVRQLVPLTILRIIQVKFGIIVKSENDLIADVCNFLSLRGHHQWINHFEKSIGFKDCQISLETQVIACIYLFLETYEILKDIISDDNKFILETTINLIKDYQNKVEKVGEIERF